MEKYITLSHEVTSALHYMRDCPDMAEINFHVGHNAPQVRPHTAPVISIMIPLLLPAPQEAPPTPPH